MSRRRYHRYTDEELDYIKAHRYDSPSAVAAKIGSSPGTVECYMRWFRQGRRIHNPKSKFYALYLRKTDELVCSGTARECAEVLGIKPKSFYVMVHKVLHGKTNKWDIYVEEPEEDFTNE